MNFIKMVFFGQYLLQFIKIDIFFVLYLTFFKIKDIISDGDTGLFLYFESKSGEL